MIESAVSEAVEQRRYGENVCVARWKPPVNGVDGTIEYYFKKESTFKPIEDENGNVDYKNLGLVRNIYHGTPIAKITPRRRELWERTSWESRSHRSMASRLNSAWARELSL